MSDRVLFDTHTHIWTMDSHRYPWRPVLKEARIPEGPATPARLLAEMTAAGVQRAVLVQPSTYGWDNSYLLSVLSGHSERFRGVVLVDPADDFAPTILRKLSHQVGVRGVRFHLLEPKQVAVFKAQAGVLLRAASEHGLVVTVQVRPAHLATLRAILSEVSLATVVVDHMGLLKADGGEREDIRSLADLQNVYVKLSGAEVVSSGGFPFADCAQLAEVLVRSFGAARIMWGSNFPHALAACSYEDLAGLPRRWLPDLSEVELRQIEFGTATSVWT